jgi:PPM family protein phosphatase
MGDSDLQVFVRAYGQTDTGVVRKNNEDAFVIADLTADRTDVGDGTTMLPVGVRGILAAVSDGMGGAEAGEVASRLVIESLRHHLEDDCEFSEIQRSIWCAVEQANQDVFAAAHGAGRASRMGATLVAVLIHRAYAHIACVGDSRAYIIRNGIIRQVTRDQSYVEFLLQSGAITREEAEHSPYKHVILQAMGHKPEVTVALGRVGMRRGDTFLLCSDGLSNKLSDRDMLEIILQNPDQRAACARLVDMAKARGGEDNITVVLAEVSGGFVPPPATGESVTRTLTTVQEFGQDGPKS